ncbi:LacI family DNA-binding transcriptional regulator [Microbacterium sp. NPDC096154]|uniref:LacI family DNA-binding transcriptional regulator n=1 Tax=Microbacterium sp. NPDC096154 TaxID=3155549 RepID=UPI0033198D76
MDRRVTLRDVAKAAGVSRTTASNVVMGTGRISDETRERVRSAMAELGYVYHQAAGALRRRTSRAVGVVVTNIHRPHFGELLLGLESTFTEAGYTSLVVSTMDRLDRQARAVSTLREHSVAGLAMIPATGSGPELLRALDDWDVPSVFVSRYVRGYDRPYVGPDDVLGGRLAGEHLLDHGCRTLAYIGGNPEVMSRIDRIAGVRQAIEARGADVALVDWVGEPSGEGGLELGRRLLREGAMPDGVLCHGDAVAMGFERALHEAGRTGDVRVIGYDGVAATGYWIPALTTVATNGYALGRQAAEELIGALEGGRAPASQLQRPRLIVRESCGAHEPAAEARRPI